jgi:glycosyltransferase involved in cell wall biosynthesis
VTNPLVTVVCLCYNQGKFVEEAITSVLNQSYGNIQLIVVDDASTDDSVQKIKHLSQSRTEIQFIALDQNLGNCKAFNRGLQTAKGQFIIDFAADDVMTPDAIEDKVKFFSGLDKSYGVIFSDALYIDVNGNVVRKHFEYLLNKKLINKIPQGDVYREVIEKFFIPSPTMMVRSEVFTTLQGYDESLAYEDFDFWIRSARIFKYAFLPKVTMKIRVSSGSMSAKAYLKGDKQLHSTYLVCKKAATLNESPEEDKALASRLRYEIRQSVFSGNRVEAELFYELLREMGYLDGISKVLINLAKLNLPLHRIRSLYLKLRFGK